MTPGYTFCPDCGAELQQGICPECGKQLEPPPIPAWWPAGLIACLAVWTTVGFLFMEKKLVNLLFSLAGACAAALIGCVIWFWAAFKYGLDKRVLLRSILGAMGVFLLDLLAITLVSVLR